MEELTTKKSKLYLTFITLISLITIAPAYGFCRRDTLYNYILCTGRPVIALGTGTAITSDFGHSQNFPSVDLNTDEFYDYKTKSANQTRALLDVFVGYEWPLCLPWLIEIGFGFNQIKTFTTSGNVLQGIDLASADQYSYQYSLLTRQLLVETKLLYQYKNIFYPYFLLGVGAAFNEAYNFSTSKPPFITFTRQYHNNTETSLSYSAGIGIDTCITPNLRVGLGYRFTNLGKVSLGSARINTTSVSGTLTQNHLYINEIIAQLSLII